MSTNASAVAVESAEPTSAPKPGEITWAHAIKVGIGLSALAILTAAAVGSVLTWRTRRKQEAMAVLWQEEADQAAAAFESDEATGGDSDSESGGAESL